MMKTGDKDIGYIFDVDNEYPKKSFIITYQKE